MKQQKKTVRTTGAVCTRSTDSCLSHLHQIGYREKAREEASRGGSLAHRPDIALATKVSGLTSQVQRTISTICPYSYHLLENVSFIYFTFKMAGISHWKPFYTSLTLRSAFIS